MYGTGVYSGRGGLTVTTVRMYVCIVTMLIYYVLYTTVLPYRCSTVPYSTVEWGAPMSDSISIISTYRTKYRSVQYVSTLAFCVYSNNTT